jgi:RHS repeat-associated protein
MTQKPERVTDLRYGFSYLVKDHLGSVRAVLNEDGKILDRFRYDPWGLRIENEGYRFRSVRQGFTGHDMLDNVGLIHMGGRVYDPLLGRFLSADPFIQAPYFSQSYNRYAYVLNNPLVLVDPSGYFFGGIGDFLGGIVGGIGNVFGSVVDAVVGKPLAWVGEQLAKGGRWLEQNWQTVAIIALAVVIGPASTWYIAALKGAAIGGLSAALHGGGPDEILRGALIGGATAGAFHGVGTAGIENEVLAAGAHGTVGGISSVAQGGTFESGFLTAAITKASGSLVPEGSSQALQVTSAAIVGGVTSVISGGSFENGAITGAFSRLFNDCSHGDLCGTNDNEPSRFERWVASLPDIPSDVSNAVQGFGSGVTWGITDKINEYMGVGGYVDRNSTMFALGDGVGSVTFAFLPAGAMRGAAYLGKLGQQYKALKVINSNRYLRFGHTPLYKGPFTYGSTYGNVPRGPTMRIGNGKPAWWNHWDLRVMGK